MNKKSLVLPEFEKPPLVEVVCDMQFESLDNLIAPYIGLFWNSIKEDFPYTSQLEPIMPIFEEFSSPNTKLKSEPLKFPSLPRIWFVEESKNVLIQLQRDRFILNWRKTSTNDKYPRYNKVINLFNKYLELFKNFIESNNIGTINPTQYEMAYINHIGKSKSFKSFNDINNIFPDFNWGTETKINILKKLDGVNLQTRFEIPNQVGRLYLKIQDAYNQDKQPIFVLEIKVRGIGKFNSYNSYKDWYDIAHESIVCTFADITSNEIQDSEWRRVR